MNVVWFNGVVVPLSVFRPYGGLSVSFGSYSMQLPDHIFLIEDYVSSYDSEDEEEAEPSGPSLFSIGLLVLL